MVPLGCFESHMHLVHMPNVSTMSVEVKVFECKLCHGQDIQEEGLNEHHFNMHQDVLFDTKMFREQKRKRVQCMICRQLLEEIHQENHMQMHHEIAIAVSTSTNGNQNNPLKANTSKKYELIVLKPFNCMVCGVRNLRGYNSNDFNPSNETCSPDLCATCRKKQPLEKEKLPKPPFEMVDHDFALVHKETIKYYRCKLCHSSGITEDQFSEHHSENHGFAYLMSQNTFQMIEAKVNGQCSVCSQRFDEEQFIEHLQQVHLQALVSSKINSSNSGRYVTLKASCMDESISSGSGDLMNISDMQKKSNKHNNNSCKSKLMPKNEVMKVIPGKQKASAQKDIFQLEDSPQNTSLLHLGREY
ncbi:uncharacterized protein LOC129579880 [Sitodiplosis mosellana]|uniref:uncharacterized protein LOC129579880 n=1 Tax=Sitodiplosis mosellana TaxID=263140 RepID=UPI002443E6B1|nr:uncharacterized protein LOC129579880 [Sitodiplosis mosellana]